MTEHTRFCFEPEGICWFLTCTCWCHGRGDMTRDGTCSAHHCDPADCRDRTHVVTVRLTGTLWDAVAAKAAARRMDTNAGAVRALEAWARDTED